MNRVVSGRVVVAVLAVAFGSATVPAADQAPAPAKVYVGTVKGGHATARVAVVVKDGEFVAYVCSREEEFNAANSGWFRGKVTAAGIDAAADDKRTLKGKLGDKSATLTVGGGKAELTAELALVAADAVAGLYRDEAEVDGQLYVAGWIIDEKGEVAGSVRGKTVATPKAVPAVATPKDAAKIAAPVGTGPTAVALQPGKVVAPAVAQFRVTSVKNLGNNVGDDSTDRIEVKWEIKPELAEKVKEYLVDVTVTYGDGTTSAKSKTAAGSARSTEVRVPFKSTTPTKSFVVRITAIPKDPEFGTFRTATKSGNF